MNCKEYIEHIRDELRCSMSYYWKAKEAKKDNDIEAFKYLSKLAVDEYEHAGLLFKMMDEHIKKKTADDKYNGVYKDLYEMSIEVLREEYKETENLIKKA